MIAPLIRWSIQNRFLVLLATVMVTAWGVWAMLRTPLDAIPDLSDVQVIIRTTYPGQAPRIVEDKAQLGKLRKGDEVEFELRGEANKDGDYVITRVAPAGARKP